MQIKLLQFNKLMEFVTIINLILFDVLHILFFTILIYSMLHLKNFSLVTTHTNYKLVLNNINFVCTKYLYAYTQILKNKGSKILIIKNIV
jgi:hypothetical protein